MGTRIIISDEILLAVGSTLLGDSIEIQIFSQISHVVRRKKLVERSSGARYTISLKITPNRIVESFPPEPSPGRVCAYWSCKVSFAERLTIYLMNTLTPRKYEFLICQFNGTNPSKESAVQNSIPQD